MILKYEEKYKTFNNYKYYKSYKQDNFNLENIQHLLRR